MVALCSGVFSVENPKEQEHLVKVLGENLKTYPQHEQVLSAAKRL